MPFTFNLILLILTTILPVYSFITSPLDFVFVPNHTRGLVCPSLRYGCCPDLATWRHGSPCAFPRAAVDPQECFDREVWACCQVDDETFTCTTGFGKGKRNREEYGWRSGTSERFLGVGKGQMTAEELLALKRRD